MSFEMLKMGHYTAFVWSSYGLTLLGLVIMMAVARNASNRELQAARRRNKVYHVSQSGDGSES